MRSTRASSSSSRTRSDAERNDLVAAAPRARRVDAARAPTMRPGRRGRAARRRHPDGPASSRRRPGGRREEAASGRPRELASSTWWLAGFRLVRALVGPPGPDQSGFRQRMRDRGGEPRTGLHIAGGVPGRGAQRVRQHHHVVGGVPQLGVSLLCARQRCRRSGEPSLGPIPQHLLSKKKV